MTTPSPTMPSGAFAAEATRARLSRGARTVTRLRQQFRTGRTRPLAWRLAQLGALARMIEENKEEIFDALHADLGKPRLEALGTEVGFALNEIDYVRRRLKRWLAPEKVSTPLLTQPGRSQVVKEPLGVVLIIGPWNYPFQLLVVPLIGALATGNCAVVKPSELAPATSAVLARRLTQYLDPDCVEVVEGGVPETTDLLEQRWDHIFYTGNGAVGRIVMAAAAKHLTPVTLELGGKSPCIVNADADLDVAARRIAWGKWTNAGQTCVAPDYVLAHRDVHDALLEKLAATVQAFYGDDPKRSIDYGRIVNARHHRRVMALLEGGGQVVVGGEADEADRYIAPTILRDVPADARLMQEEIFGPLLPVLSVRDLDEAIDFVNDRDKPLALYLFTSETAAQQAVIDRTSAGGMTINHTVMHLAVPGLPFGGVGESGMGAYHGEASLETFTHRKSVLTKPTAMDPSLMYPPYGATKQAILGRLL